MNRDFVEMLSALCEAAVEFLVVGAHALAAHGTPRATGDLDMPPCRIDLLTQISGVSFEEAWPRRLEVQIEGLPVPVLGKDDFVKNKRAAGRPKDLADLALLGEDQA